MFHLSFNIKCYFLESTVSHSDADKNEGIGGEYFLNFGIYWLYSLLWTSFARIRDMVWSKENVLSVFNFIKVGIWWKIITFCHCFPPEWEIVSAYIVLRNSPFIEKNLCRLVLLKMWYRYASHRLWVPGEFPGNKDTIVTFHATGDCPDIRLCLLTMPLSCFNIY